ncbi:MAG: vWA domain-containing protein, partial [Planctomycetota bacterium]
MQWKRWARVRTRTSRWTMAALAGLLALLPVWAGACRHRPALILRESRPLTVIGPPPAEGGGLSIPGYGAEEYDAVPHHPFRRTAEPGNDASTFAVDVDTASYANVRRILMKNRMAPPPGAVRIEEFVNAFATEDAPPGPDAAHPLAVHAEVGRCPWARSHRLVRVALKARTVSDDAWPGCNLVFLVDVSGSMASGDKLPLVVTGLRMLAERLTARDRIAIVTYAGSSGVALPSTPGDRTRTIRNALDRLRAGGSTNGEAGIRLAYRLARQHRIEGGANRVILCTDGDFNVGISDRSRLVDLVAAEAAGGVDLTVLGVGAGNYRDGAMEALSNRGNGVAHYIDSEREARKVLVERAAGTLITVARDVKVQVFFDPGRVTAWRLIGYENRRLAREDFGDDTRDGGEVGAGHCVVALYEIVPPGVSVPGRGSDPNPFVRSAPVAPAAPNAPAMSAAPNASNASDGALLQVRVRYCPPAGGPSVLVERMAPDRVVETPGRDFRWTTAVAGAGLLLRQSPYAGDLTWAMVDALARSARTPDPDGERAGFLELVRVARILVPGEG